jgi:hypothetical protein
LRRDKSAAVYSVSLVYQHPPKLKYLLCRRSRTSLTRIGRQCQLWLHGPRHPLTRVQHSGGECQKISPSHSTSLAEEGPTLSRLSCHHPSYRPTVQEPRRIATRRIQTTPTSRKTATILALCRSSRHCRRCVRTMTGQGVFQSRFRERQGYTITL